MRVASSQMLCHAKILAVTPVELQPGTNGWTLSVRVRLAWDQLPRAQLNEAIVGVALRGGGRVVAVDEVALSVGHLGDGFAEELW